MMKRYTWEEVQAAAAAVHEEYRKKLAPYLGEALDEESGPRYHKLVDEYHAAVKRVREDHGWTEHRPELIDTKAKLSARIDQLWAGQEMLALTLGKRFDSTAASEVVLVEALKSAADGGMSPPQFAGSSDRALQSLRVWCNDDEGGPAAQEKPSVDAKEAKRKATIEERMELAIRKHPESLGWSITQWMVHLDCSRAGVHRTKAWETLHASHVVAEVERKERQKKQRGLNKKGIDKRKTGRNID